MKGTRMAMLGCWAALTQNGSICKGSCSGYERRPTADLADSVTELMTEKVDELGPQMSTAIVQADEHLGREMAISLVRPLAGNSKPLLLDTRFPRIYLLRKPWSKLSKCITQQQRQENLQDNSKGASLGKVDSGQQGIPNHHQATAHKIQVTQKKIIATWNVRTPYQAGRLDNVIYEMKKLKTNIMGISEVPWIGAGTCQNINKTLIYSCGTSHTNGVGILMDENMAKSVLGQWAVSERVLLVRFRGQPFDLAIIQVYAPTTDGTNEDIEKFYEELEQAKNRCKSQDIVIVMGDLNAKVGQGADGNTIGKFGLGERSEKWVE
ncbi:craniofacial development protein 2-like [Mobula hypostoma]|uniref:craniofacial development protein 2-like n=1 Tax=Mobula hypostoma TaxID=723540 RepID=UPI002FC37E6B